MEAFDQFAYRYLIDTVYIHKISIVSETRARYMVVRETLLFDTVQCQWCE